MYVATRAYLKSDSLQNFVFYNFSRYLDSQPLKILELLEITHKTVTFSLSSKKFILLEFLTFARILVFRTKKRIP